MAPAAVRLALPALAAVLLLGGCGDGATGPGGVAAPPPPSDVLGIIGDFGTGERDLVLALTWLVRTPVAATGCHVYRSVGGTAFARITDRPVEHAPGFGYWYIDSDADVLSLEEHVYYVTAVDADSVESAPSPRVSLVPATISNEEQVEGMAPSGDTTGVSTTPVFSWTAKDGAVTYCIILQDWDAPESPIVWMYRDSETSFACGDTSGVTYVPLAAGELVPDTHYRWQIEAVDSGNTAFAWQEALFWTGE